MFSQNTTFGTLHALQESSLHLFLAVSITRIISADVCK